APARPPQHLPPQFAPRRRGYGRESGQSATITTPWNDSLAAGRTGRRAGGPPGGYADTSGGQGGCWLGLRSVGGGGRWRVRWVGRPRAGPQVGRWGPQVARQVGRWGPTGGASRLLAHGAGDIGAVLAAVDRDLLDPPVGRLAGRGKVTPLTHHGQHPATGGDQCAVGHSGPGVQHMHALEALGLTGSFDHVALA